MHTNQPSFHAQFIKAPKPLKTLPRKDPKPRIRNQQAKDRQPLAQHEINHVVKNARILDLEPFDQSQAQ